MEQSLNNVGKAQVQPIRKEHNSPFKVPHGLEVQTVTQMKRVNHYFDTFSAFIKNITLTGATHITSAAMTMRPHKKACIIFFKFVN